MHLREDGRQLWLGVQYEYNISDPAGLELLRQAAECADRIASARKQIDTDGELLTIRGGFIRCAPSSGTSGRRWCAASAISIWILSR
jgi:hypothetical protein